MNTRIRRLSMRDCSRRRKRSSTTKSPATARSKAWADKLSLAEAVKLLDQTLTEEKKTDQTLSKIAVSAVNAEAA